LNRLPKGGVACEVGVAQGYYSLQIIERNAPRKLYLIDAWSKAKFKDAEPAYQHVQSQFKGDIAWGRVEMLRGLSSVMLSTLPDKILDWIYIDAAHDYESVKKDLEVAQQKVKSEGYICGHDYTRWASFGQRFGVLEAVNEFANREGYRLAFLTLDHNRNWSYALTRIS
jgi:hypothetical protein